MKKELFEFQAEDGKTIYAAKICADKPKAILQIAHGMAEHKERYFGFAAFLAAEGYTVYIHDHRGHGHTAQTEEENGFFAEKNGWDFIISDMKKLNDIIRQENPGIPVFLMGHSMGSFATRKFISLYGETLSGVIISGTATHPGLLGKIGATIAKTICTFKGAAYHTPLMDKLAFGAFNKPFEPAETGFEWLSRDNNEVKAYAEDPECGFICTASFYRDVFKAIMNVNSTKVFNQSPKAIPYFMFSGEKDPVGNNGKGVKKVYNNFKKAGIENINLKLYPNGRHEMLNEINKDEVYNDILNWLEQKV
jgi:alpha-beta hydrolase superfamily lysophospholipase